MDNKMVYIEWNDSSSEKPEWQLLRNVENEIFRYATIGFMLSDTAEFITIAQNYTLEKPFEEMFVSGTITIPKNSITKMEELSMVKSIPYEGK